MDLYYLDVLSSVKEIKIALELKIRGPSKSLESGKETFETYFSKIKKDFRKLNTTIKKGWIDAGYFIFVYQSSKLNEKQIEKILVKTLDGKLEFHPIIINKFKVTKYSRRIFVQCYAILHGMVWKS